MNLKKHLPNALTLLNLFCGCLLVIYTLSDFTFNFGGNWLNIPSDNYLVLISLLALSLFFDLLDGMVARWLNVASPIGLQLDSLADMVTFGLFPGILMMKMLNEVTGNSPMALLGLGITLFSALRLAKFNVDTTQTSYFKGLATPANAILILGIFILSINYPDFFKQNGFNIYLSATIISCYLLICNLPLFSFKLKSFELNKILPQILLLVFSIILLIFIGWNALAPIILIYIILSLIFKKSFVHA